MAAHGTSPSPAGSPWQAENRSDPTVAAGPPASGGARPGRSSHQLAGQATLALLVASLAVALVTGFPDCYRAVGPSQPAAARPGIGEAMRARGYARAPADGEPAGKGDWGAPSDGLPRAPSAIGAGRSAAPELERRTREALQGDGEPGQPAAGEQPPAPWGFTAGPVSLRERANPGAPVVAELSAGQMVVVAQAEGAWLLVGFREGDALSFGWVERSRVVQPPAELE